VTVIKAFVCAVFLGIVFAAPGHAAQRPRAAAPPKPAAPAAQRGTTVRTERAVPFAVGETLTYDVSWSAYVTAGTATIRVAEKKPSYGSTAFYVVAEGRPTPLVSKLYSLYYKIDALLDAYTLLPAPSFPSWSAQGVEIDLTISVAVVTATRLYIERASVPINDQAVSAIGSYYYDDLGLTINTDYDYRARIFSTNWPAAIQYSTFTNQTINSGSRL